MTPEEFLIIIDKESKSNYGLMPNPISSEKGLDILINHFLGKDWHVVPSMSKDQTYTEAIYEILKKNQKSKVKSWIYNVFKLKRQ